VNRGSYAQEINQDLLDAVEDLRNTGTSPDQIFDVIQRHIRQSPHSDRVLKIALHALYQVLDETLRLYPQAWIGPRKAREDFEIYGQTIPGGTQVAYSSLLTHRLPSVFDNPEMFDPGRFTPEKKRRIPPGGYVPFGRGPRTCIGMNFGKLEVKAIVTALLQSYDLELVSGQDFRVRHAPTLSPRYGVDVRMHERDMNKVSVQQDVKGKPENGTSEQSDSEGCPVHDS